jgi:glycosyltransferase involved in cell wall biosynthesis
MVTQPLFLAVSTFNCGSEIPAFERWLSPVSGFFEKIVIVDDGSSDDTILHLQGLKRRVKNLSVILRKRNSGRPSLPRNDALRALPTNGRVVFLDVDDRLPYSYLEMLKSTTNGKIYSGVKYACKTVEFDPNVNCNFSSGRLVQEKHLRFKNHITFSGSSLPLETAKSYEFINEPLEDWVYWQQISADGHTIFRLTGVPIGFNSDMGLSPRSLHK